MKFTIALFFTMVVMGVICHGQNLTALIEKCNGDVGRWKAEADRRHAQFVTYVTVSTLVSFLTITGTIINLVYSTIIAKGSTIVSLILISATICYCTRPQVTNVIRRYRQNE